MSTHRDGMHDEGTRVVGVRDGDVRDEPVHAAFLPRGRDHHGRKHRGNLGGRAWRGRQRGECEGQ